MYLRVGEIWFDYFHVAFFVTHFLGTIFDIDSELTNTESVSASAGYQDAYFGKSPYNLLICCFGLMFLLSLEEMCFSTLR